MPTVLPASMPQCSAMFSTKLVLPIDGRAATMTRSDFWKPDVISSRSTKPARHAGDEAAVLLELLDELIAGIDELAHADESGAQPVLGDLEDRPLRVVEQVVGVLLGVVRAHEHVGGRLDQPAQRGFFLDDLRVVLDVGRPRHAVGERADVGGAADLVELARPGQLVLQRDEIDRLAPIGQRDHLLEDAPVRVAEEIRRVDDLGRLVERLVVDEDRAEHALLGFEIVRQGAIGHGKRDSSANRS